LLKVRAEEKESPLIIAVAVGERQEEEKKNKERGGGIIWSINLMCVKVPPNNIVNFNIDVELKNTDFDGQKRDGPLWAVHIKKTWRTPMWLNAWSFKN